MVIGMKNNEMTSMGDNCARVTLYADLKDTALAVVSFFAYYLRFYFPCFYFALLQCRAKSSLDHVCPCAC